MIFTNIKNNEPFIEKTDTNLKIIADYDKNMLNYIGRLYKDLNGDTVDIDELENIVDVLASYKNKSEKSYLENLIHPEKAKGCKIPSPIPVPSTSFQLHNSFTLTTNSRGNLGFVFNPFFLYNTNDMDPINAVNPSSDNPFTPIYFSTFSFNNNSELDGHTLNHGFVPMNIGQGIPGVYDQYRLVSASLIMKYIGRMDITSGVIGGAVVFNETEQIAGAVSPSGGGSINCYQPDVDKFSNFDLAMDSFYHQENLCIEGLRMLYFPIDNTFEEYTKLYGSSVATLSNTGTTYTFLGDENIHKSGFNWMVYVLGAPPSASCFKVDFYLNFECLPNASFLNYMPITPSCHYVSNQEKKESITIVQQKPVMKSTESIIIKKNKESAWKTLKKAFQGALPSISKLITKGLIEAIPYMKPGLALANSLISATTSQQPTANLNMSVEEDVE